MMNKRFFVHKHKVDGEISLEIDGQHVKISCRWPFDLSTDEWIWISNTFRLEDYTSKVRRLPEGRKVTIRGIQSGQLSFEMRPSGEIMFDIVGAGDPRGQRLIFPISAAPKDLLPPEENADRQP